MLPFKNILSPTDFSETSFKAIEVANELAQQSSARLALLHVVSISLAGRMPTNFDIKGYVRELESHARKHLKEIIKKTTSKEIICVPLVTIGACADEIVRVAHCEKSDLIVMGTRGRTSPAVFFGSVVERVLLLAPCPVLTTGQNIVVEPRSFLVEDLEDTAWACSLNHDAEIFKSRFGLSRSRGAGKAIRK